MTVEATSLGGGAGGALDGAGKARVVYFQQNPAWGGCEDYLRLLIEGVKQRRRDWELFLVCPRGTGEQWHQAVGQHAEVIPVSQNIFALFRLFRRLRTDLIHINDLAVKAMAAARLANVPRVVMTYHTPSLDIRYNWRGRLLWWFGIRARNLRVVALSSANKRLLQTKYSFSEQQVDTIPHGLEAKRFTATVDTTGVRNELGIDPEVFVLICVARLAPQKAHTVLLEGLAKVLTASQQPVRLLLVGDGEERLKLEAYARRLGLDGLVHFLGHRDDIPRLLASSDLFVLSSDYEGLPSAILEAMAMGKPVVSTAVDGIKDLVSSDTGILVPTRDPQALADGILSILARPEEASRLGSKGKARFFSNFTVEKWLERTLRYYDGLF